jgi:hypothetical protein
VGPQIGHGHGEVLLEATQRLERRRVHAPAVLGPVPGGKTEKENTDEFTETKS